MKIAEIINTITAYAPLDLQEGYDNAGLQVGDVWQDATGALLCVDVTEAIVNEAIEKGCNLIITHHPLLFKGLKRITGRTPIEQIVMKAIKNDIVIYSAHTNLDNAMNGVSFKMAEKIGLQHLNVLSKQHGRLFKLVVFVPNVAVEKVRKAMSDAGAGILGNYDCCSYQMNGEGTFRAKEGAEPWVGEIGELHKESEIRLEVLVERDKKYAVLNAMLEAHPYEEPAYDLIALENESKYTGCGVIGELPEAMDALDFLSLLKTTFEVGAVRYSGELKKIKRVAMCGGSGAEFVTDAISAKADIYVTGDIKYHDFTTHNNAILMADIGHYESEQYTKEIFSEIIRKNFPNFVTYNAELEKNPINYL